MGDLDNITTGPEARAFERKARGKGIGSFLMSALLAVTLAGTKPSLAKADDHSSRSGNNPSTYCQPYEQGEAVNLKTMPVYPENGTIRGAVLAASREHFDNPESQNRFYNQEIQYLTAIGWDVDADITDQCTVPVCVDMLGCRPSQRFSDEHEEGSTTTDREEPESAGDTSSEDTGSEDSGCIADLARNTSWYQRMRDDFMSYTPKIQEDAESGVYATTEQELLDLLVQYGAKRDSSGRWVNDESSRLHVYERTYTVLNEERASDSDAPGTVQHKAYFVRVGGDCFSDEGNYVVRFKRDEEGRIIDVNWGRRGIDTESENPQHFAGCNPYVVSYNSIWSGQDAVNAEIGLDYLCQAGILTGVILALGNPDNGSSSGGGSGGSSGGGQPWEE
ncbi:hypothetical protein GF345_05410 [Candidatus Woesearchaeota archaeon]|nr:hypothetical protein [Candidatus Woesearchaeota archaeon]